MDDLQGGLNQVSAPAPAPVAQPQIEQPAIKEPVANLQDKALSEVEATRAALNAQMKKMIDSANTRSTNNLFDPKLMALATGLLAPTKTGGFGESLGAGLGKMSEAATAEEKERQENAKMRLEMMQTGLSLQEKQLAQDLMGKLYKVDAQGNPTSEVDAAVANKLARLTGDPKFQQLAVSEQAKIYEREQFSRVFPSKTITDANGAQRTILEFNPGAVNEYIKKSADPMEAAKKITENVALMRKQGLLGDSTQNGTAFDSLVLLAKDSPVIQQRAAHLATLQKSGRMTEEEAEKEATKLTDLYAKELDKKEGRQQAEAMRQLMFSLKQDQFNFMKQQAQTKQEQAKGETTFATKNVLNNLNMFDEQVSHVQDHPGRYNGVDIGIATKYIPGTDAKDYVSAVQTLKSKGFLNQVQQMHGMGALSDAEGKKISDALANLDVAQSKEEFDFNINQIKEAIAEAKENQVKRASVYGITQEDLGLKAPGTEKKATPTLEDAVKAAGWNYDPAHWNYRVNADGTVQRKAK